MKKRYSVRLFEQKPVSKEILNQIIEAGNLAPSSGNTKHIEQAGQKKTIIDYQPWRFVVVQNSEFQKKLFSTIEPFRSNFYDGLKTSVPEMYDRAMKLTEAMDEPKDLIFYSAPVVVYVIGSAGNATGCAMVCENIMLAAVSFGLGSCYVGFGALVKDNPEIVNTLELTEGERIYGPIVLGYPKVNPTQKQAKIMEELRSKKIQPKIKWI